MMGKRVRNPKSLRTAVKYGWTPVTVKRQEKLSWLGVTIQVDRMIKGRYVRAYDSHGGGKMAFEEPQDAVLVSLRFG